MKHLKHLFTALLLLFSVAANAHDFEVAGIYYNITDATNKTVAVTYRGSSYSNYSNEYTGNVVIPESVAYNGNTYSVTSIGDDAFRYCSGLTSIEISNSVTSIGTSAFSYCSGLTSITIPNSVTSIGDYAFLDCSGLKAVYISDISAWCNINFSSSDANPLYYAKKLYLNGELVTDLVIPGGVTKIKNYAFAYCSGLTSVVIGNSVTSIGEFAFEGCFGLKTVINHSSLAITKGSSDYGVALYADKVINAPNGSIEGDFVFGVIDGVNVLTQYLGNETRVELPDNYRGEGYIIGARAFANNTHVEKIAIPECVTAIGDAAFYGCTNLLKITMSDNVVSVGVGAFANTSWYKNEPDGLIYAGKVLYKYKGTMPSNTSIEVREGTTQICGSAFYDCSGLTSIEIPNSVTSIGDYAFCGCSALTSVVIPNSVTSIGNDAFNCCFVLTSVVIGNSVTSIGMKAFYGCWSLTNVTIGKGVTSIGESAFSDCSRLTSIVIPDSVTSIGEYAFYNCSGLTSITIPNSVTSIGGYAFEGCSGLKTVINFSSLTITKGSSDNGGVAYYANKVVNAPNGEFVGDYVFCTVDGESSLAGYIGDDTELVLPSDYNGGNYAIRASAFRQCTSITGVVIPNSVTSIGDNSFAYCMALNSLTLGENVAYIGEGAFEECSALSKIISQVPADGLFVPGDYAFESVDKETCILYVPEGAVSAYKSTGGWGEFENIVDFAPYFTVTYIVDGEEYETMTVEYGKEIPLPATPEKEGHTFSGWSEIPATMPAEDITVTGSFAVNYYTVTYKVDGEVYATDSVSYGSEIVLIEEPTKEGYTFSGWSEVPETMLAEDITVTGSFAVNYYTVTYMVDGEVYATDSVSYGEEIVLIEAPVKEGYTFSGWSEVPETMPAENITVTGSFTLLETGIDQVLIDSGEVVIYDLNGLRIVDVHELKRGVYIVNGKKQFVK